MKIAATYENGNIFQHFGRTEQFKVYEVEDGKVVSSELIGSNGSGHGALASLLNDKGIDVLICGGIGGGAQNALAERGIELCAGASGNTDEAVEAYLRGELINTGANCDHHHHEDGHSCGDHGCGDHDHDCGDCHGGPEGKNVGKRVRAHYRGTFNDGTQFDSSYDRGEPLEFVCGAGQMIPGFDIAVRDMEVGQTVNIRIEPKDAYGERDENAMMPVPRRMLQGEPIAGAQVMLMSPQGQPVPAVIASFDEEKIILDMNHPMAGKALNFEIELLSAE